MTESNPDPKPRSSFVPTTLFIMWFVIVMGMMLALGCAVYYFFMHPGSLEILFDMINRNFPLGATPLDSQPGGWILGV